MVGTTIATIQKLASRFAHYECNLTLYFADLDTPPDPGSYNRVFGPPVGLADGQWPTFPELAELLMQTGGMQHYDPADQRMEHVFTIDLRGVNLLGVPPDAAAMMLFISNASFHRANTDGNRHTQVLFLSREDLRRGPYLGSLPKRSMYRWSRRFSLVPINVPGDVFDVPHLDLPVDDPLVELYEAIAQAPARLGGCPIGLEDEAEGTWGESSPTLPRGTRRPEGASLPPVVHESSPTVMVSPDEDDDCTRLYRPQQVAESSRTIPYDPHRRADMQADRLLEQVRGAYDDGDPTSALTFGRRSRPRTSPAFLMQFHRRFADINLGRQGVMYVSGRSAYSQATAH